MLSWVGVRITTVMYCAVEFRRCVRFGNLFMMRVFRMEISYNVLLTELMFPTLLQRY